ECQMRTVWRPGRRERRSTNAGEGDKTIQVERIHADVYCSLAEFDESDARVIRRNPWRQRDAAQMRDLVLAVTVVVHSPNLFCTGAIADEYDLALRHAKNSASQAKDDLIGKFVRDVTRVVGRGVFAILFAQNLRRDCVLHVVEPAVDRDLSATHSQIA